MAGHQEVCVFHSLREKRKRFYQEPKCLRHILIAGVGMDSLPTLGVREILFISLFFLDQTK